MSFDGKLASRVRDILSERPEMLERKMFGGLCFLIAGKMACGIVGSDLMVRVGSAAHAKALSLPHARLMDFTGRPMLGFVYVASAGLRSEVGLRKWVAMGADYALIAKPAKRRRRRFARR